MNIYYSNKLIELARDLRNNPTRAEKVLWNTLRNKKLGYDFHRQKPMGFFIYDFYCYKLRLVIEVDGATHSLPEVLQNDKLKDENALSHGFQILRLTDDDVLQRGDYAEDLIRNLILEIETKLKL